MLQIVWSIAPIFALIVLGHALRRGGIPSIEFWNLNDKLVYWVLFPALLFYKTSTIELSPQLLGPYALVILGGFGIAVLFGLAAGRLLQLSGPVSSSLLQGAARHNTFIALAVAERLFGSEGLALAALATSLLIPATNVVMVAALVMLLRSDGSGGLGRALLRDLIRNPLLISVFLGVLVNLSGIGKIPVLHDVTDILGRAALPVVLLCIGANIQAKGLRAATLPLTVAAVGKFLLFPFAAAGLIALVGLEAKAALVALVYASVPTASSAYTLARQMGGDAPLMAAIITLQTLVSFLTLPLTLALAQEFFL